MQPVDTFQQLQSLHELEFAGSPRIESAMFSPNGRTVYVQTAAEVIDVWPILLAYWPAIGGTLLFLTLLVVGWWVIRVRSDPERAGAWLCRRCRYEVTNQVDDDGIPHAGAVCAECGRSLGVVRVRRGRTQIRRLVRPITVLGLVIALFGLGLAAKFGGWGSGSSNMVWPSRDLAHWAKQENINWLTSKVRSVDRIVDIDFETGEVGRDRLLKSSTYEPMLLSEDGRTFYRTIFQPPVVQQESYVEAVDVNTGRVRRVATLPMDTGPGMVSEARSLAGFMDEGQRLLVIGRRADTHLVLSVDIRTGQVTELISEPAVAKREAWTGIVDNVYDASVLVTCSGFTEMYETKEAVIRAYALGQAIEQTSTHTFKAGSGIGQELIATGAAPVLLQGGQTAVIKSGDVTRSLIGLDLRSDARTHLNTPPGMGGGGVRQVWDNIALSPDGRWIALAEVGGPETGLLLRDTQSRQWVGELGFRRGVVRPVAAFSRDGSRLASFGFYDASTAGGNKYAYRLALFDLASVVNKADGE